jgi:AcrR family transcriptional regulator
MDPAADSTPPTSVDGTRRATVLDAALVTFARFGYRKTSMDDIAAEAHISRPGLYFLFSSKGALFREAAERAIEVDLAAAERALAAPERPLLDRVVEAFDHWAGRYVGPLSDVAALIERNADLVGPLAQVGPPRFERILVEALAAASSAADPLAVAQALISVSVGLKHQARTREEYLVRLRSAASLIIG